MRHNTCSVVVKSKRMNQPGIEPGSRAWKAHILTVGLPIRHTAASEYTLDMYCFFIVARAPRDCMQAARKEAAEAAAASDAAAVASRATHILFELVPPIASPSKIDAVRAELAGKADEAVTAAWEEAKAKAGEAEREAAEADKAAADEAAAAAAAAAEEAGNPAPEPDAAAAVDVEQRVADAVAAVEKSAAAEVTDADVLNAMMEADAALQDSVITALALQALGAAAWTQDERFADELGPPADAES